MTSKPTHLKVLMFALGSTGDVLPFCGAGEALRARGHSVCVVANSYFEPIARRAGIEFLSSGPASDYLQVIENPELWESKRAYRLMFEKMLDAVPFTYNVIAERYAGEPCVVVAPAIAFGARIAQEKHGVPLVGMNVETNIFRSSHETPGRNAPAALAPFLPLLRRPMMDALDRWFFDPQLAPRLNEFRSKLGLPPVQRVMRQWLHSPACVIGLMPEWFAPKQPDWPPNLHLTGFPMFDDAASNDASQDLEEFLNNGELPVVFTPGTAMRFGMKFFQTSAEMCRRLNLRGIFLTRFSEQIPTDLPSGVRHFPYIPLGTLLPRAKALVHHGGIGTTAQALRAGIPQLLTPMIFDQSHNAARLRRLGVGDSIPADRYEPNEGTRRLERLLSSPQVMTNCNDIARRFLNDDPMTRICQLIENTASAELSPSDSRNVLSPYKKVAN